MTRYTHHQVARVVIWIAVAVMMLSLLVAISRGDVGRCYDAVCRVRSGDGVTGTGVVFERSQGYVFVLTNAHVASTQQLTCEFWRDGHQSKPMQAELAGWNDRIDAAVVRVAEAAFADVFPEEVPLAEPDFRLRPMQAICSVGCAEGGWATGWKGHVLSDDGQEVRFTPPPKNGRSGSPLLSIDGEQIVGLIKARTMDDRIGIAVSTAAIHEALAVPTRWRICPPGGCDPRGSPQQPYGQQPAPEQPRGPWPTLPQQRPLVPVEPKPRTYKAPQETPPATPEPSTCSPLLDKLRRSNEALAEQLRELRDSIKGRSEPDEAKPPPPPNVPPPPQGEEDEQRRLLSLLKMMAQFHASGGGQRASPPRSAIAEASDDSSPRGSFWSLIAPSLLTYGLPLLGIGGTGAAAVWAGYYGVRWLRRRRDMDSTPTVTPPPAPVSPVPDAALPSLPVDYAKIWYDHVKATGGRPEHDALRYQLYREAVDRLRAGQINVQANHIAIADAIDAWVYDEFYRRVSQWMPDENLYHNALLGFLYKEAVARLRRGEIQVLGHREVADAIDAWVRREFYQRLTTQPKPQE